jgi:DNA-binding transcriptional ArsR family regulator
MHHPDAVHVLQHLFVGYGSRPPWQRRQAAALAKCYSMLALPRAGGTSAPGARRWQRNIEITASWKPSPATRDLARLTASYVSYNLPFVETYGSAAIAALGDPTRRAIFESLARRPKAVGELAAELPISRPAVSQHLRVLKEAGLVTDRADGTRRIYQIRQQGVQAIHGYLDQMWGHAMAAFQAEAERAASRVPAGTPAPRQDRAPRRGVSRRARDRGG